MPMMFGNNQSPLFHTGAPHSLVQNVNSALNTSRLGFQEPSTTCSSSVGSLLLLGFSNFEEFNGVDLLNFVNEHSATLNFPQKLMLMLTHVDRENAESGKKDGGCVSWTRDGHAFVIRSRSEFVKRLLPLFFREAKFSSFTRKLYRWGFRQICIPKGHNKKERDMIFGQEHFQRDDKPLMANMRSVTAAGTRRAIAALNARKKAKDSEQPPSKDSEDSRKGRVPTTPHDPCSLGGSTVLAPPNKGDANMHQVGSVQTPKGQSPIARIRSSSEERPATNLSLAELVRSGPSSVLSQVRVETASAQGPSFLGGNTLPTFNFQGQAALLAPVQDQLRNQANTFLLQNQLAYLQALTQTNSLNSGLLPALAYTPQQPSNTTEGGVLGDLQKLLNANANASAAPNGVQNARTSKFLLRFAPR